MLAIFSHNLNSYLQVVLKLFHLTWWNEEYGPDSGDMT